MRIAPLVWRIPPDAARLQQAPAVLDTALLIAVLHARHALEARTRRRRAMWPARRVVRMAAAAEVHRQVHAMLDTAVPMAA